VANSPAVLATVVTGKWKTADADSTNVRGTQQPLSMRKSNQAVWGGVGHIVSPEQVSRRSQVGASPAKRATGSCSRLTQSDASPRGGVR
jgi:hypothetical protein